MHLLNADAIFPNSSVRKFAKTYTEHRSV